MMAPGQPHVWCPTERFGSVSLKHHDKSAHAEDLLPCMFSAHVVAGPAKGSRAKTGACPQLRSQRTDGGGCPRWPDP